MANAATSRYSRMMATTAALLLVIVMSAANVHAADPPCDAAHPGAYHLSCYTATETPNTAAGAKKECIDAFVATKPECKGSVVVTSGSDKYGCGTYIAYVFPTDACRDAYQAQEKSNAACKKYDSAKLGAANNRAKATVSTDYDCK